MPSRSSASAGADLAAAIREGRFTIDDYVALIADGSYTVEAAIADSRTFADTFGESSLSEESRTHAAPSGVCDHPHAGGSP